MLYQEEREYANLAYSIICLWLEFNVSSPVRYSYLSILPDDNADIFAAFCQYHTAVVHLIRNCHD